MNVKRFIFKIVAILTYIVKLMLILLPITYIGVTTKEGAWRYGFTFIQNNNMPQGLGTGGLYTNNIESPLEIEGEEIMYNPNLKWENKFNL